MPFGLRNAGATYQRLMDKVFGEDIGVTVEVYIDDLVIISPGEELMLKNIQRTFDSLRKVNLKPNPVKCSFGMEEGKFLGFIVTKDSFKVNLEKVEAIRRMPSPASIKEMQRLAGRVAALNRFLANHAAKFPFHKHIAQLCKKESVSMDSRVGAMLLVERDGVRTPIHCISKMLTGPEIRYSIIEKLILILSKPDVAGRLAKWAIELGGHNILYKPRPAIKGQVLADFISEVPIDKIQECEAIQNPVPVFDDSVWILHTDGAYNDDSVGASLCLVSPDNHEFTYAIQLDLKNTNNEAEYEAFLGGLRLAIKMGAKNLEAHAKALIAKFQTFKVIHINRSENKHADALSKLAATRIKHLAKEVRIEVLTNPSIPLRHVNIVEVGNPSWMSLVIMFLQHGTLPEGKAEARKIQNNVLNYEMSDGILYRKSYMGPLLRCVDKHDAQYLVREIHVGLCGIHAGPRMVVAKWAIDLVGPFPDAPGAVKFLIVAVDYFTKWVEAKPLASTTELVIRKFIWEHIICRFGLPLCIITDNGTNFASEDLEKWMKEMRIEHSFASVAYPQANG
ncbi:uncharacterized protein LOC110943234 [Helianthus annuus]|uniref:uncharacterized protein LOC110943234 n=1 Tax=Helianthus annuus TaxID=4232 RepID=UPI000B900D83|nr:uncharacterized protein LOC110943234 [Helianthus annuus]